MEKEVYNKYEHNHSEWDDWRLQARLTELYENNKVVGYTGERLEQVQREMSIIAFEIAERYRETRDVQIEQAWNEHSGATL